MDKAEHMAKVRERLAEHEISNEPQARMDIITSRLKKMYVNELALALQNERVPKKKFVWLRKLTDTLGKATEGVVPCRDGCSHCCNMATLITAREAREIAKITGRAMTMPSRVVLTQDDVIDVHKYTGVPCPMLKENRCSIYENRPFSCRVHYSVDKDELLCKLVPGESDITAPYINTEKFVLLHALAHPDPLEMDLADIRDFFPEAT